MDYADQLSERETRDQKVICSRCGFPEWDSQVEPNAKNEPLCRFCCELEDQVIYIPAEQPVVDSPKKLWNLVVAFSCCVALWFFVIWAVIR